MAPIGVRRLDFASRGCRLRQSALLSNSHFDRFWLARSIPSSLRSRGMYAVIRRYSGVAKLIHELEKRQDEVKKLVSEVPGFIAYYAIREGEALATVTVCKDRAGADDSSRATDRKSVV